MSSRKRKKRSKAAEAAVETPAAATAIAPAEAGAGADKADADPEAEAQPAVSHIDELRPRDGDETPEEPRRESFAAAGGGEAEVAAEAEAEADDEPEAEAIPETTRGAPKSRAHLKRTLESLIFVSDTIISIAQLARIVKSKQAEVRELLAELSIEYEGRGIELVEVAGGYQFRSCAASAPFVRDLVAQRPARLTRAQLETLALIAYRQPITRPEIDDVRGVDSGSAIKVLCERDLVKILGRKDEAGRPLLYGTTPFFLEFFGMSAMSDLPTLREFTELSDEHRELFQRKTGEIPDLSNEPAPEHDDTPDREEVDGEAAEATANDEVDGEAAEAKAKGEPAEAEPHDVEDDESDAREEVEASDDETAADPTTPPHSDNVSLHDDDADADAPQS
jgi:segregation and condensation protein B